MLVSFPRAEEISDRFLALLQRLNIDPPRGSRIEDELLSATALMDVWRNPDSVAGEDRADVIRAASGLHDMAAKVLSVETAEEFDSFIPHLKLIAEARFSRASLRQNGEGDPTDDVARKMAELYIACLATHIGTGVDLDSPSAAKGDNPDVLFTLIPDVPNSQPQRWALAIKTVSSRSGQTLFERIAEGARQIDHQRCRTDRGLVIVNVKGALDHEALWNASFGNLGDAIRALGDQVDELVRRAEENRPTSEWDDLFLHRVARPVLFLAQSVVRLETGAGSVPTSLKMIKTFSACGDVDPIGYGLAAHLNMWMQTVLAGEPGDAEQLPS